MAEGEYYGGSVQVNKITMRIIIMACVVVCCVFMSTSYNHIFGVFYEFFMRIIGTFSKN